VVGETIPDHVLEPMRSVDGSALVRSPAGEGRRAWFQVGAADAKALRPQDFSCDLAVVLERFPAFPPTA
jgi:hypothetical protein